MKSFEIAEPCRNFCILGSTLIPEDPKDKREKYVLANYVAGGLGKLIIIDTHTWQSESYEFPEDEGAWAVMYLQDKEKLILGTCANKGYLHSFDLRSRSFEKSLRIESETYLWNFARAKDGNVYASTYPGCILVKYDPEHCLLTNVGRVGNDMENLYSRWTHTNTDGNILVNAGFHTIEAYRYDIDNGTFTKFGDDGDSIIKAYPDVILVQNGNFYKCYDPYTLQLIEQPVSQSSLEDLSYISVPAARRALEETANPPYLSLLPGKKGFHIETLSDGRAVGIKGQEMFVIENDTISFMMIPAQAPVTNIMTISAAPDGTLWGSCEFGQTIFHYEPVTRKYENTAAVANAGGEVYGITHARGKLFLTSYVGGDHVVYDPAEKWNQHGNVNPKTVGSVAPEMVRPHGKSVIGPDGNVWTGWCANYGVYGGGITKINTKTYEVTKWFGLIPDQAVEHITASGKYLYAVTSGEASGLDAKKDGFYILKLNTDGEIVWKKQYEEGIHFRRVASVGNYVLVSMVDANCGFSKILVFDEETMEECQSVFLGEYKEENGYDNVVIEMVRYDPTSVIAFVGAEALHIQVPSGTILDRCPIDGLTQTATVDNGKRVYFSIKSKLYCLNIQ